MEISTATMRIELTIQRAGRDVEVVELTSPSDALVGDVLDALGARTGLTDIAGAVQAQSQVTGQWLSRSLPLADAGLLRGEDLRLVVALSPAGPDGPLQRWVNVPAVDDAGRIRINRTPRRIEPEPRVQLRIPPPPAPRPRLRIPIGGIVLPLVLALALAFALKQASLALLGLMSPLLAIWNVVEDRRQGTKSGRTGSRAYSVEVAELTARASAYATSWHTWSNLAYLAPTDLLDDARTNPVALWGRRPGDPDFLTLCLGIGALRAPAAIADGAGDDEVVPAVERALVIEDVPVTVNLDTEHVVAVVGSPVALDGMANSLITQLSCLHSPADVSFVLVLNAQSAVDRWRWLPHVASQSGSLPITSNRAEAQSLLEQLASAGRSRMADRERTGRDALRRQPTSILMIDGRVGVDPRVVAEVIALVPAGVRVLWFGDNAGLVPGDATAVVTLGETAAQIERGDRSVVRFRSDALSAEDAHTLARLLAPLADASSTSDTVQLPGSVSLEQLVDDLGSPAACRRAWESVEPDQLLAPIGVSTSGPVYLDLGQTGDHVLIGGTTGSGKSELLQTIVAGLAARYPPTRVGFLLIDYKGGAAFKDATRLPHTVGTVTDLDRHLTRRVLMALNAEVRRRERLLANHGARDVHELRRMTSSAALAELVIVIDEFATLSREIPEFVEGVVDLAARGRSLGLRLILATQRPAGVITERIRANVGVRIALRLNDEADSMDVVGSRDAAHIPQRFAGRAFLASLRSLTEFQTAYVGAPIRAAASGSITVRPLAGDDRAAPLHSAGSSGTSVLEAVVEASNNVMRRGQWPAPHVPWLPPLPELVTLAELGEETRSEHLRPGSVLLARSDQPQLQQQRAVALDLDRHQHMLIFGTTGSGKTSTLRTIAFGLIESLSPQELELYVLDFAGHGLHLIERAPQCAAVVGADDVGRVYRVLRRLHTLVDERRSELAHRGAGRVATPEAGAVVGHPRVVVLIDSYSSVVAMLERIEGGRLLDQLQRTIAEGPAVGVHFVITAERRAAVPGSLLSVITNRLVLRLADRDEYRLLGVEASTVIADSMAPGRGYLQGGIEVQVGTAATLGTDETAALAMACESAARRWPGQRASKVGSMPAGVDVADLPAPDQPLVVPFAIGDETLAVLSADLGAGHLLVTGPPRSGRSTALETFARQLYRGPDRPVLVLLTARTSPLEALPFWDFQPADAPGGADQAAALEAIHAALADGREAVCFCDDVDELPDPVSAQLEQLVRRGRTKPVHLVAAADNRAALRSYGGLIPELRKSKHGILLAPDIDLDGDLVGVRLRSSVETTSGPGRGFYAKGGVAELVQVAMWRGTDDTSRQEGRAR